MWAASVGGLSGGVAGCRAAPPRRSLLLTAYGPAGATQVLRGRECRVGRVTDRRVIFGSGGSDLRRGDAGQGRKSRVSRHVVPPVGWRGCRGPGLPVLRQGE